jgi:hypothetical protein
MPGGIWPSPGLASSHTPPEGGAGSNEFLRPPVSSRWLKSNLGSKSFVLLPAGYGAKVQAGTLSLA